MVNYKLCLESEISHAEIERASKQLKYHRLGGADFLINEFSMGVCSVSR